MNLGDSDKAKAGFIGKTPDELTTEVLDKVLSTPEGRAAAERLAARDNQLSAFQRAHGVSEAIAEAAIKEWVLTHNGNFDWDIDQVKAICLRNLRSGIPNQYLPLSQQK